MKEASENFMQLMRSDNSPVPREPFGDPVERALSDRGYVVASLDNLVIWARSGSLMWMT